MKFQRKNEILGLDGFRGLLSFWIFWFHVNLQDHTIFSSKILVSIIKGGPIAVDGFFALSGFILTHVYHKIFEDCFSKNLSKTAIGSFFTTFIKFLYFRIARIWPLHVILSFLWIKPFFFDWRCNWWEYFSEITFATPLIMPEKWVGVCNAASWSIINEFYAYMLFPILYFILYKFNIKNSTIINILMIGVIFGFLLIAQWIWYYFSHDCSWKFFLLKYFKINMTVFEFFAGMALYRIYKIHNEKHVAFDFIGLFFGILIIFLCICFNYMDYYQIYSYTILIFPFLLVKMDGFLFNIFNSKLFRFLGDISFSFYLSHSFWLNYFAAKVFFFFL